MPSDGLTAAGFTTSSDGSSSYVPTYSVGVTTGCIVQWAAVPTATQDIFKNYTGGKSGMMLLVDGSLKFQIYFGNGTTGTPASSSSGPVDGHAYLLVGTWNLTTIELYNYDLTAQTEGNQPSASLSGTSWTVPGSWSVGASQLAGTLARVFVLPLALTSSEVNALYLSALALPSLGAPTLQAVNRSATW